MRQGELIALDGTTWILGRPSFESVGVTRAARSGRRRTVSGETSISSQTSSIFSLAGVAKSRRTPMNLSSTGIRHRFLSPTFLLRRQLYPAMASGADPAGWAHAGATNVPQLPTHVCQAGARERRSDHVAFTSPRPFLAQGDHRHLRALGARRAKAPGSEDGRRLPRLTAARVLPGTSSRGPWMCWPK